MVQTCEFVHVFQITLSSCKLSFEQVLAIRVITIRIIQIPLIIRIQDFVTHALSATALYWHSLDGALAEVF